MARSLWTGSLSFGLVNVPVKLYPATEDKQVRFHQFDSESGQRIHNVRVNDDGDEVPYEQISKGYEISSGTHVLVTPEELESIEPKRTKTIEIEDFVPLAEIDPIYFDTTYYVAPAEPESGAKPYRLLRTAMEEEQQAGIARLVMRTKEHLAAIRPSDGLLLLETLFFGDEVRDPQRVDEFEDFQTGRDARGRELRMARDLVASLSTTWDPTRYADTYRERVLQLIERKAKGEEIVTEPVEEAEATNVYDLTSVLRASLDEARRPRQSSRSRSVRRLDRLSKEKLYERAKERGIAGRSRMSKSELVAAIREAS